LCKVARGNGRPSRRCRNLRCVSADFPGPLLSVVHQRTDAGVAVDAGVHVYEMALCPFQELDECGS